MGNRGEDSPKKKPAAKKLLNSQALPERRITTTPSKSVASASFKKPKLSSALRIPTVVINSECKRLADQALSRTNNNNNNHIIATNNKRAESKYRGESPSKSSDSSCPIKNGSPSAIGKRQKASETSKRSSLPTRERPSRRRKALTKALKKLRSPPVRKPTLSPYRAGSRQQSGISTRSTSSNCRALRPRPSLSPAAKPTPSITLSPPKKRRKMELSSSNTPSNPKDVHEAGPMSSSKETKRQVSDPSFDSSSDDIQPPILEKPVLSDKEERDSDEDDGPPDDSDYESSLLSPSALPAPIVKKKKKAAAADSKPSPKRSSTPDPAVTPKSPRVPTSFTPSSNNSNQLSQPHFNFEASPSPEKRGRGRPRKLMSDLKMNKKRKIPAATAQPLENEMDSASSSSLQLYLPSELDSNPLSSQQLVMSLSPFQPSPLPNSPQPQQSSPPSANPQKRNPPASPSDTQNFRKRLQRWKDRSTFVYAKHKFVKNNADKFRCKTCEVNFTALSSLKRHYGTIYHKQQEQQCRLERNSPGPSSGQDCSSPTTSANNGQEQSRRGGGKGKRTTKSAADSIKKYYAAMNAARRNKNHPSSAAGGGTWLQQKQQRKRKPLQHSDFLYPSSSADSDGEDDRGSNSGNPYYFDENNENNYPGGNGDDDDDFLNNGLGLEKSQKEQKLWLSSKWKGIGTPHFTCEVCNESFQNKWDFTGHLYQHRQEEDKVQSLTCPDCQAIFGTESVMAHHFKLFNHGPFGDNAGRVKRFVCFKCGSAFSQKEYYKKHLETHKRPPIPCPHCNLVFDYKFYLNDHIKADHDGCTFNGNSGSNNGNSNTGGPGGGPSPTSAGGKGQAKSGKKIDPFKSDNSGKGKRKSISEEGVAVAGGGAGGGGKRKGGGKGKGGTKTVPDCNSSLNVESIQEEITLGITMPMMLDVDEPSGSKFFDEEIALEERPKEDKVNLLQKFFDSQSVDPLLDGTEEGRMTESGSEKPAEKKVQSTDPEVVWGEESMLSSASGMAVAQSTTESGDLVFQFDMPMSSDHSLFDGFDLKDKESSNISPLTIEIPSQNLNVDEEIKREEEQQQQHQSNPTTSATVAAEDENKTEAEEAGSGKDQDVVDTNPEASVKSTSSTISINLNLPALGSPLAALANLPLIGCGTKWAVKDKPEENPLTCQDCGKIFEHRKSLVKHVHYYRQSEDFACSICSKTFKLKHHVSRHMKSFHNVDTQSTTSSTTSEDAGDPADLLNSPTGVGSSGFTTVAPPSGGGSSGDKILSPAGSPVKGSSSSSKPPAPPKERERKTSGATVPSHKKAGSKSESFTAVVEFTGNTFFKCLVCFKVYPTRPQLNAHMSTHDTETADKSESSSNMGVSGARGKFPCEICPDKCFTWRKDLLRHRREKHGIFNKKSKEEQKSVDPKPSPQRCSFCPMVFPGESDLNEHISQAHQDDKEKDKNKKGKGNEPVSKEGQDEDEEDDRPPTPSPHTSPIPMIADENDEEEEAEDVEEEEEDEEGRSSPEFELLELN